MSWICSPLRLEMLWKLIYVWPWSVQAFLRNPWFSILQFVADVNIFNNNNLIIFNNNNLRQSQSLWNTILREIRSFTYFSLKYQNIIVYICHKLSEQNQGLWKNACTDHGHTHINFHNLSSRRGQQIQLNNFDWKTLK